MKGIFDKFLDTPTLFLKKAVLSSSYIPEILFHREKQIEDSVKILVPALKGDTPSNIFIYGKTGTGKTCVVKYLGKEMKKAAERLKVPANFIYINCEVVDTHYRVLANIANQLIDSSWDERIPMTGWPTDEVYSRLVAEIDEKGGVTGIVLDEIDSLFFKSGDSALYALSRLNSELKNAKVYIIGISNDLRFTELMDPRVKSSLGEEELIFPPYNAEQLNGILMQRAELAFKKGAFEEGVIPLCSGLAAREHGDARRAIDLLRISGEIADRSGSELVGREHVYSAQSQIDVDRIGEAVKKLPVQSKLVLLSIINANRKDKDKLTSGDLYEEYCKICPSGVVEVLTSRRIRDLIGDLDMLGIISTRIVSRGAYGRTKEINLESPAEQLLNAMAEDEFLTELIDLKKIQRRIDEF